MEEGAAKGVLLMKPHPGGQKDGLKSSAFGIGLEEEEGHPLSSWREAGRGRKGLADGGWGGAR